MWDRHCKRAECEYDSHTFLRVLEDLPVEDFNVAIASAITSLARLRLWELIDDVEHRGGKVYMCDTDSIVCNLKLEIRLILHQPNSLSRNPFLTCP